MFIDMYLKTRHLHYYMKNGVFYKADCSSLKLLTTKKPFNNVPKIFDMLLREFDYHSGG